MAGNDGKLTRRSAAGLILGGSLAAALPLRAQTTDAATSGDTVEMEAPVRGTTRHNLAAFVTRDWKPYFKSLKKGAILVDIDSRCLHFWSEDESIYKLYPCSVPLTEDLTRRGRTRVVRKVKNPSWRPTPSMKRRNPDWPDYIPPGPDNPLGTHALYLSWRYYRIHGTHDTRKIGRRSSNGCIGLYNEHIAELFELAQIGTQVLLI